jgi:hypothetical protein
VRHSPLVYPSLVTDRPAPDLSFRLGCPLALILAGSLVVAFEGALAWTRGRPIELGPWDYFAWNLATMGAPFLVLALARTSDRLAWLLAVLLTVGLYAYVLYDLSFHRGAHPVFGFLVMIVAPIVISGLCLIVAGLRGRVPWAMK